MKKIMAYLSVFILLCFFTDSAIKYSIAQQINEQSPYCLSFASIGANLLESRLDSWAKIKSLRTFAEMDQELINILTLLDLPINKENFLHQEQNEKKILRYELLQNDQSYLFTLQSEADNSYFLLTSTTEHDDQKLREAEKKLRTAMNCKSYFRYQGVIHAYPDREGRKKLLQVACKSLGAQIVDQYEDDNLTTMTGFSSRLESMVDTAAIAGKSYNLQIAMHTDPQRKQSYIYMGFPLLLNDY